MDALSDRIADLIRDGRKIEAIKAIREETGASLADAKAAVDRIAAGLSSPDPEPASGGAPGDDDLDGAVRALVAEGRVITAIKLVRERTGGDLAASKAYVEALLPEGAAPQPQAQRGVLAIAILAALLAMGAAMAVLFLSGA